VARNQAPWLKNLIHPPTSLAIVQVLVLHDGHNEGFPMEAPAGGWGTAEGEGSEEEEEEEEDGDERAGGRRRVGADGSYVPRVSASQARRCATLGVHLTRCAFPQRSRRNDATELAHADMTTLPKVDTNCTAPSLMPTIIGSTFAASLRTDICPQRKEARPRLTLGIRLISTF
jgi:hypothetical protein